MTQDSQKRPISAGHDRAFFFWAAVLAAVLLVLLHESIFAGKGLVPADGILRYSPWNETTVPANYLLTGYSDSTLMIKIKSEGFSWFSDRYIKDPEPVEVNLSQVKIIHRGDHYLGVIPTASLSHVLANQLDLANRPLSIFPDTLYVNLERKAERPIPGRMEENIQRISDTILHDSVISPSDSLVKTGIENNFK